MPTNRLHQLFACLLTASLTATAADRPNVVFFAVDDMNDWISPMGYEQAVTPNMDRLAARGVTFQNAHTAGIYCAPSRSAIFTGRHASTTGCYGNQVYHRDHPDVVPLQQVLQRAGYLTFGGGKLFHHPAGYVDLRGWDEFFVRDPAQKSAAWDLNNWPLDHPAIPKPFPNSIYNKGKQVTGGLFLEWGRVPNDKEHLMADTIRIDWACKTIRQTHAKPFFTAVGIYAPHFPNYAPAKYFDLYDRDAITLPPYRDDDLDDLSPPVRRRMTNRGRQHHDKLVELNALKDAIHGYLASISYADAMLGRLLDAIDNGPNADNTIIVMWSDHGYHHGEKRQWGKHTLWERTSNVPLMWAGPGIAKGASIDATVSLIDLFPTLTDLCGATDSQSRDGTSLAPILAAPATATDRTVLMPGDKPNEYALMNLDWRYARYADGAEELYQVRQDPNEWHNLAGNPEFAAVKQQLATKAPTTFATPGPDRSKLKMIVEGESFRWELKKPRQK